MGKSLAVLGYVIAEENLLMTQALAAYRMAMEQALFEVVSATMGKSQLILRREPFFDWN